MLGGLSKWLRAAGYDAEFEHGIDDAELVARGRRTRRVVLSSDGGIFERRVVRQGLLSSLFIPMGLLVPAQLAFVVRELALPSVCLVAWPAAVSSSSARRPRSPAKCRH